MFLKGWLKCYSACLRQKLLLILLLTFLHFKERCWNIKGTTTNDKFKRHFEKCLSKQDPHIGRWLGGLRSKTQKNVDFHQGIRGLRLTVGGVAENITSKWVWQNRSRLKDSHNYFWWEKTKSSFFNSNIFHIMKASHLNEAVFKPLLPKLLLIAFLWREDYNVTTIQQRSWNTWQFVIWPIQFRLHSICSHYGYLWRNLSELLPQGQLQKKNQTFL